MKNLAHSIAAVTCVPKYTILLIFTSKKPQSKSAAGIEARDISAGYESAYVQVAELPNGATTINDVKPAFLSQIIFNSSGKFGMIFQLC